MISSIICSRSEIVSSRIDLVPTSFFISEIINIPEPQHGSMAFQFDLSTILNASEITLSASHSGVKYSPIECLTDWGIIDMYKSLNTSIGS